MSERAQRPTLARIAAELGVSVMSVSNAYNRPDQLSAALRARILEKARELGYPGPTRWPGACATHLPPEWLPTKLIVRDSTGPPPRGSIPRRG